MDKLRHVLFASAPHALCKKERVLFGGVTCPSVVSACVRDVVFDVTDNEAKYKNSFVICKKANKKETRGGFFSPALPVDWTSTGLGFATFLRCAFWGWNVSFSRLQVSLVSCRFGFHIWFG